MMVLFQFANIRILIQSQLACVCDNDMNGVVSVCKYTIFNPIIVVLKSALDILHGVLWRGGF